MLIWYLIIILVLSLGASFFILGRKALKLEEYLSKEGWQNEVKEKQAEIKKRLLEKKLEKKIARLKDSVLNLPWAYAAKLFKETRHKVSKELKKRNLSPRGFKLNWKIKRSLPKKENQPMDYLLQAKVFLKKHKLDEAEEMFIKVLEHDPKNVEAYMGLGKIYVARNDLATAEEAYRYIVKIKPKFLEGYKELGRLFENIKKWTELKELMEEIIGLGHHEAWAHAYLGLAYRRLGYPEKAEEHFERAVAIEPRSEKWLDYLIETAIINKNKNLALKAFNTLSQLSVDAIKLQGYRDKIDLL